MTPEINQGAISSVSSIIGSIKNDRQVYRWFLMLVRLPEITKVLSVPNKVNKEYLCLKKIQTTKIITYAITVFIAAASCLIKQPWVLLGEVVPLVIFVNLFQENRRCVAAISERFLLENIQPDELVQQTLYQICENLSKKFNIPTLVDIITFQDRIGRVVLLGAILFLPFIYPFKTWETWVVVVIIMSVTIVVVNASFVLRKSK